jgi:ubiquinone/menaquinone biosynthesis C-methylase UbiE
MSNSDLKTSVDIVAKDWKVSAYYEEAEKNIGIFWRETSVFRGMFEMLDLQSTLELACGYGRHAAQIVDRCGSLMLMDVHESNLQRCKERLKHHDNIRYEKNNGFDFNPASSNSLTAIFCYDAMVHFNPEVVESYIRDAKRVLQRKGRALLHHSNYPGKGGATYGSNPHARNHMMQDEFFNITKAAGMKVILSVPLRWGTEMDLDCISLIEGS